MRSNAAWFGRLGGSEPEWLFQSALIRTAAGIFAPDGVTEDLLERAASDWYRDSGVCGSSSQYVLGCRLAYTSADGVQTIDGGALRR